MIFEKGRIYPPVVLLAHLIVMGALHFLLPVARWIPAPDRYSGIGVAGIAFLFVISIAQQFRRRGTTIKPFQESSALITDGLYRLSRNPIYLAMIFVLIGFAIYLGSVTPWLVIPFFPVIITYRFIRAEEAMLELAFGDEYRDYKERVSRWIGPV